jgi:hypothetical protein
MKNGYAAPGDFLPSPPPLAGNGLRQRTIAAPEKALFARAEYARAPSRASPSPTQLTSEMTARRRLDGRIGSLPSRATQAPLTRAGHRHVPSSPSPTRPPFAHQPRSTPSLPPRQAPALAPPPHVGRPHHAGRVCAVFLGHRPQRARNAPRGGSLRRTLARRGRRTLRPRQRLHSGPRRHQRKRHGGVPCSIHASISASSAAVMQPGAPMAPSHGGLA